MKYSRIWCRRTTAMLLLAALFAVHCWNYPVAGDVSAGGTVTVAAEEDEGGPEEVWLEYDLGIPDHAFRKKHSRGRPEATASSLEDRNPAAASSSDLKATGSTLSSRFRALAASPSSLGVTEFLIGMLPASPSVLLRNAGAKRVNIHVKKTWGDGASAHSGESVTVHLLANGEDTGRSAELSGDNQWETDFAGLPASDGTGVIDYRITEDTPSGYVPFYTYSGGVDDRDYWIPAETLEEGETYVLAAEGIAPTAEGGEDPVIMRLLNRQTRARRLDGVLCHDYITDPEEDAMWVFSTGTRGWEMTSLETGEMLAFDRIGTNYVFTLRDAPTAAKRAYFPFDPSTGENGIQGEIRGKSAREQALGSEGDALTKGEGALFRVYRRSTGDWELEVTIDNRQSERPDPKVTIPHRKTIDAFRDGEENPDTNLDNTAENTDDLYRLYLDAGTVNETRPLNVVLVLDYSGSMNPRQDDPRRESYYMDGRTRYEVLRDTLCPVERDGIVDLILSDADNRMSLVTFSWMYQENTVIAADWTDSAEEIRQVILNGNPAEGTNYDLALRMVSELLERIPEERKDYPTYVLFMSDGVPTEYVTSAGLPGGYVSPGVTEVSGPGGTYGSVGVETVQNLRVVIPKTLEAVERFRDAWPNVNISTVAFSNQSMSSVICVPQYIGGEETEECMEMTEGYTYDMVLREMIQNRGAFYTAANGEELRESFEDMILASRVSHAMISDELSAYVDLYELQPDYKVTMKKEGEDAIVLWENGERTPEGEGKLERVFYDGQKTVSAEFKPDYVLEEDFVYTLSFNVKTTPFAYEQYAERTDAGEEGYGGTVGDSSERHPRETDYGENRTSTGMPGFHSDEEARFVYSVKGRMYEDPYLHPVVQVREHTLEIRKVDSSDETKTLPGAEFDLYRRIEEDSSSQGISLPGADPEEQFQKVNRETLVTGADGTVSTAHLVPGVYRIREIKAPEGYQLPDTTWQVLLGRPDAGAEETGSLVTLLGEGGDDTVLLVRNMAKVMLPATGGMGSAVFLLAGMSAAAAGAVMRRHYRS